MRLTHTPALRPGVDSLREDGLPWLTPEVWYNPPLGYSGLKLIWNYAELCDDSMAPRFPKGCQVNVAPVVERKNLVVGRVYLFDGHHPDTGQPFCQIARLVSVHDTHLLVRADQVPTLTVWPLRAEEDKAVWDVYEVTHYVKWPLDNTAASAPGSLPIAA
ncbi:hypothetical protein [Hymenobacter sp. BT559]|uniref:hypothetical protein n=1 Tax=Hymenobacter sp. BT559 TaxID=2795729 RepID=UPI0018EA58E9|nr:hypothetical protein [Hymenobacter sp. BT559]MBJ6141785.1 hypothetical protein [Hymenobacter sp. BT559]